MSCIGRNRSGEQEVLAKKKIDRAPLVLGMPCCIKSCLRTLNADIHLHTRRLMRATMCTNTLTLANIYACKQVALHAAITNRHHKHKLFLCFARYSRLPLFKIIFVQRADSAAPHPALCRCVTFLPHFPLPRSLSCAWTY